MGVGIPETLKKKEREKSNMLNHMFSLIRLLHFLRLISSSHVVHAHWALGNYDGLEN